MKGGCDEDNNFDHRTTGPDPVFLFESGCQGNVSLASREEKTGRA
jgi:hypothetical protein